MKTIRRSSPLGFDFIGEHEEVMVSKRRTETRRLLEKQIVGANPCIYKESICVNLKIHQYR